MYGVMEGGRGSAILNFFNTPHRSSLPKFSLKRPTHDHKPPQESRRNLESATRARPSAYPRAHPRATQRRPQADHGRRLHPGRRGDRSRLLKVLPAPEDAVYLGARLGRAGDNLCAGKARLANRRPHEGQVRPHAPRLHARVRRPQGCPPEQIREA